MHCSNCGTVLTQNLNYCQHCGSRNQRSRMTNTPSPAGLLIAAAGAIGTVGLIAFYPVLRELLHSQLTPPAVAIILISYLATVLLMFSVLVVFGWKRSGEGRTDESMRPDDLAYTPPTSFRRVNTAQLEPAMDRPASVTEHTTRTLEDVPVLRK